MTDTVAAPVSSSGAPQELSPRRLALRRFLRHRLAVVGAVVLLVVVLAAVVGPLLLPFDPNAVDPSAIRQPPNAEHLLGTDSAGRDVLARLLAGGRVSLLVGLTVALTATVIGLVLGAIAGFFGGWVDSVLSRITDVVLSFPTLIVVIIIVAFTGPSITTMILAVGLFEWPTAFRIVRGLVLSLRDQDSIRAVRGLGASTAHILVRHVIPSVIAPLTVVATILVAQAILLEAGLSFLGLGVPPPTASWGNMLNEAQSFTVLQSMPWLWIPAGCAIAITVLAVNFIGDGLRDASDPRSHR
ncbi:oligopeptide ABC transporter permease [Microbacterium sp. Se5.02b]|uniref:oligopeptide ABC transporter permease n=1 Tax=Microbacterium sp. Se5.02b TaxID=2864103 RepID=UPI001C68FAFD|nr:oligopeptide ABC transporter permease [Microbacterium sp. Se5.02b]QYM64079.1 ABC transporter permease [Microbacterium sp. Se5.02b]